MSMMITLAVKNLQRTQAFYAQICQLAIERHLLLDDMPPVLILQQGGGTILFRELASLQALHPTVFEAADRHPLGMGVTIELEVTDLDATRRLIAHHQIHVLYELQDEESGWRELWLHDPDGYLIILSQHSPEK